ncbi:uncharacterized protein [Littorina saxatilis]|uniref:Uncharacterized protein n=1 Tax=Littorina saxatilis TaxID=31220 RepID=A0AAN9GEP3_9CAEN
MSQSEESTRPKREVRYTEKYQLYKEEMDAKKGQNAKPPSATVTPKEDTFKDTYEAWKRGMQTIRQNLKHQLSDEELTNVIQTAENLRKCVLEAFTNITTPDHLTLRRMDCCSANTNNIVSLAQIRMSETDQLAWNQEEETARLRVMLDTEYAHSVYGSKTSGSGRSCSSSASLWSSQESIATKRAEALAKLAAQEVEMQTRQEIAAERARLDRLEAEQNIRATKAMIKAYDELGHPEARPTVRQGAHKDNVTTHNQTLVNDNRQPPCAHVSYSRLPPCEPSTFTGDPLQFVKWKRSFEGLIGHTHISYAEKLALLERYTAGEAYECIEGAFFRFDTEAYDDAWRTLNERYGHPSVILNAFRKKLNNWPKVGGREYNDLRRFSDFLVTVDNASPHIPGLKHLDDEEENKKLLQKLPDWIITKWGNVVAQHDTDGRSYPSFHCFTQFLASQAKVATRPVCSLQALKEDKGETKPSHPTKYRGPNRTAVSMATTTDQQVNHTQNTPDVDSQSTRKLCVFCKQTNHFLPNCQTFQARPAEERRTFVKEQRRCFRCLRTGHHAKDCKNHHTCKKCQGKHPTALHDDNFVNKKGDRTKDAAGTQATETTATTCKVSCNASSHSALTVPVWISTKQDPDKERLVYALIDSQSDTTFVERSVVDFLNPSSRETTRLKIETLRDDIQSGIVCDRVSDLRVRAYNSDTFVELPPAYSIDYIPLRQSTIPTCNTAKSWSHLQQIAHELPPLLNCDPGVLIGFNCSHAFLPRQYIVGGDSEPFAVRTDLGWGIVGKTSPTSQGSSSENVSVCNRVTTKELPVIKPKDACRILERDFEQDEKDGKPTSQEDELFMNILSANVARDSDGHLQMPLPFKKKPVLPNNYVLAAQRLEHLKKKLQRNTEYYNEYNEFMNDIIRRGDAEEAKETTGQEWYIPHHGVFHPQKKKLRVVFDCSAKFNNTCLNDHLLVGPNLINNLVGILSRFRQHSVAFTCDVEKMFHQFRVTEEHCDFLRFLWWKDGNLTDSPAVYRMKVHLFGAASSPGCANYGLKHLAKENQDKFTEGSHFIERDFYVDDGLSSQPTEEKAINLIKEAVAICSTGGLRLHKFASNSHKVMESIPMSERNGNMQTMDLNFHDLPLERTLGMQWSIDNDTLHFSFMPSERPCTRRGILAIVASLYDPLGLIAPYVLTGKQILQEVCHKGTKWDDPVPIELQSAWNTWKEDMDQLKLVSIPRCYYPANFGSITNVQLHHFSDASTTGYGMCTYLRLVNAEGQTHCSLVAAKARVAPKKIVSIPRLELAAAVVAAEVGHAIKQELSYTISEEFFWTDSRVVLGYINNEARRFHVFVANRVQKIRNLSDPSQWHYVPSEDNPADHASRGLRAAELMHSKWFSGPKFLWETKLSLPSATSSALKPEDPEVRTALTTQTTSCAVDLDDRLSRFSSWNVAARVMTRILRLNKSRDKSSTAELSVEEIHNAKLSIIRGVQSQFLAAEISCLSKKGSLPQTNKLHRTEPFLQDGILRVGGRLKKGSFSMGEKHPIILPKNSHVTRLVILHCHEKIKHQGRGMTLNEIRSQGFWVPGGSKQVAKVLSKCVVCRKLRSDAQGQQMADLPKERVEPSPPFTYVGMDCFGPMLVKNGRKEVKRYGLLFTCFCSRAVHLEMLDDMTTDSLINGIRCFIAIRGAAQKIFCDQGTNFVGADNELRSALKEMDEDELKQRLRDHQIQFVFNTPYASHAGGVWERQVQTVKSVLRATTALCPGRLDDSSLRTMLYESMAIVNCRPITAVHQGDPTSPEPLTPNHILTMKSSVPLPPPGKFMTEDLFLRKRWRRVQFLAQQFWSRWRKEYILALTQRQKWLHPKRNLKVGDVVLVKDQELPRNQWPLARVVAASPDDDGLVRHVTLNIAAKDLDKNGKRRSKLSVVERPVHKLILILESN